jgi:hypothetical protein
MNRFLPRFSFSNLYILDLSYNLISGNIPKEILANKVKRFYIEMNYLDGVLDPSVRDYLCFGGRLYNLTGNPILLSNAGALKCLPDVETPENNSSSEVTVYIVSLWIIFIVIICFVTGAYKYKQHIRSVKEVGDGSFYA